MALNMSEEPVGIGAVLGAVLTSGVAMVAGFCNCLTVDQTALVIGFGNALIVAGVIFWTRRHAWSRKSVEQVANVAAGTGDAAHAVSTVSVGGK